jgi:hypothetical protein
MKQFAVLQLSGCARMPTRMPRVNARIIPVALSARQAAWVPLALVSWYIPV